jgi:hypothetical protein
MESDEAKKLEANRDYLAQWLERHKKAQFVAPYIQMNLEITEWEIQALANRPDEASEIPLTGLSARFDRDRNYLSNVLPMMPEYEPHELVNSTAVWTSGSASVYEYVTRVGELGTPNALAYSQKYTLSYNELQNAQARPNEVRALIERLNSPQTLQRFDRALSAHYAARSGTGQRTAAASEMRTLLDGLQGDLFARARKWKKENMTWATMAERLSKGKSGQTEQQELANQEAARTRLISQLSDVLKNREGSSSMNLDNLWAQVLDHIYIVLGLINFGDERA